MSEQEELKNISELMVRLLRSSETNFKDLKDRYLDSSFATFVYVDPLNLGAFSKEQTIHDISPVVLIRKVSDTTTPEVGHMYAHNLHYILRAKARKLFMRIVEESGMLNNGDLSYDRFITTLNKSKLLTQQEKVFLVNNLALRRYDFNKIKGNIKILSPDELAHFLSYWSRDKYNEIIEENEFGNRPLSEQFYKRLKG